MAWTLTDDLAAYDAVAGPLLTAEPERYTLFLSILARLRKLGLTAFGAKSPYFGWWPSADAGSARAVALRTPPHPMLISQLPGSSADELASALIGHVDRPSEVNGAEPDAAAFARAWSALTGQGFEVRQRQRLHRLGTLRPPDPCPAGDARVATATDAAVAISWHNEFAAEMGQEAGSAELVRDRLDAGQLMLWQVSGEAVSLAGLTEVLAGVARVGPVYTPPALRGAGFGGAVTSAISQLAFDRGARSVVLFTDIANPVSNALYLKLGFRPVEDRVLLTLGH